MSKRFGPKSKDHPSIGELCPICHQPFEEGDYTTLVSLGPGKDKDSRQRAKEGRPYNSIALEAHYECSSLCYEDRDRDSSE